MTFKIKIKANEVLEKIITQPGDIIFVKSDKRHKPLIKVFPRERTS